MRTYVLSLAPSAVLAGLLISITAYARSKVPVPVPVPVPVRVERRGRR